MILQEHCNGAKDKTYIVHKLPAVIQSGNVMSLYDCITAGNIMSLYDCITAGNVMSKQCTSFSLAALQCHVKGLYYNWQYNVLILQGHCNGAKDKTYIVQKLPAVIQ
jgi:hypothetical protein